MRFNFPSHAFIFILLLSPITLVGNFQNVYSQTTGQWTLTMESGWKNINNSQYGVTAEERKNGANISITTFADGTFTGTGTGWVEIVENGGICDEYGRTDVTISFSGYLGYMERLAGMSFNITPEEFVVNEINCDDPQSYSASTVVIENGFRGLDIELKDGAVYGSGADTYASQSDGIAYYTRLEVHGSYTSGTTGGESTGGESPGGTQSQNYGGYSNWDEYCKAEYGGDYSYDAANNACIIISSQDSDNDAIDDSVDQCIGLLEDYYGENDADGCPEKDTDGDNIYDYIDACPNEKEDFGEDFTDGCPEPECPKLTITPTLPPVSDPRNLATSTDTTSYRLRVDWDGTVPTKVHFSVNGGDGATIIPQFVFNPANMLQSPISVLLDVTTQDASEGEYPLVVNAWVIDTESGPECNTEDSAQVMLVVSEESRAVALDEFVEPEFAEPEVPAVGTVKTLEGTATITEADGTVANSNELKIGQVIQTGQNTDTNVQIKIGDGETINLKENTRVGIVGITSTDGQNIAITNIPDFDPDLIADDIAKSKSKPEKELTFGEISAIGTGTIVGGLIAGFFLPELLIAAGVIGAGAIVGYTLYEGSAYFATSDSDEQNQRNVIFTPGGAFVHKKTEFTVAVEDGTTKLNVLDGEVYFVPYDNSPSTVINSGKSILISDNKVEETKLDTALIDKWWEVSAEQPKSSGGCLIATATFGSELAPQVQFLREIRDNTVLSTTSGTSFMTAFNSFYYSFSPTIADLERQNPMFKETVKVAIIPLLSSLSLLQYVDIDSETEMLGYGIGILLLNIGMYFVAPALIIFKLKNGKFNFQT